MVSHRMTVIGRVPHAWLIASLLLLAALACPAIAADAARGRALYESRCDHCHTTSVHVRVSRKATDFMGVRMQVVRWNEQLGGAWSAVEIDDVTVYLNDRFYKYPCPSTHCSAGTARHGGTPVAGNAVVTTDAAKAGPVPPRPVPRLPSQPLGG